MEAGRQSYSWENLAFDSHMTASVGDLVAFAS